MLRFWSLARALTTVSAAAAFRRAAPLYFGIGIAAAVLFAGNGLDAATVVALAERSWPVRLGLWASWLVALTPLAHTLLEDPATRWLRSLPVPRSHFWLVCGVHLAAAELPWTILWGRGGGWLAGAAATALAVAAHALVVARPRGVLEWLAAAFVATAIAIPAVPEEGEGLATQRLAMLVVGLWGARVGVAAAFGRAPEHDRRRARRTVGGPAPVALALAHLAMLRRGEGATLGRGTALTLLGSAIAALAIRSNGVTSLEGRLVVALAAMALPVALASAALARPLSAGERAADGFLAAHAAGPGLRALA
ncbi:MAG: hypothetical protein HY908_01125, partial [Myxococcales bacterium]|nr:hypothetical protein [Myxococcales bacterium]